MSTEQYLNELSVRLAYKRQQMDLKVFVKMTLFKSVQDKLFGWPSYKQSDVFFYNTDSSRVWRGNCLMFIRLAYKRQQIE